MDFKKKKIIIMGVKTDFYPTHTVTPFYFVS